MFLSYSEATRQNEPATAFLPPWPAGWQMSEAACGMTTLYVDWGEGFSLQAAGAGWLNNRPPWSAVIFFSFGCDAMRRGLLVAL